MSTTKRTPPVARTRKLSATLVLKSKLLESAKKSVVQQRLNRVIQGEKFSEAVRDRMADVEPALLDDEFYQRIASDMVSLVSPNRRIFDELSRGKFEMSAAMFANYLAKTLFDCELLVIPSEK